MILPTLTYEKQLWNQGYIVIGVDEVGRGAFAGPLCVGGVVFNPNSDIKSLESLGINDSKKLSPQKRKMLNKIIQELSMHYHISTISVAQINRYGIGKATFMAMRDVVKNLREKIDKEGNQDKKFVLVDGFYIKNLKGIGLGNQKGIIKGDSISISIAAASIIAKVYRDEQMIKYSFEYSEFKFNENKGYGTLFHRNALKKFGKTKLHRTEFVKNFI